jgi:hypothetical protein
MGGIYEVRRWDDLRRQYIHTKFHKDWLRHSKVDWGGRDTHQTHRQHGDAMSLLLFTFFKWKEAKITKYKNLHVIALCVSMFIVDIVHVSYGIFSWIPIHSVIANIGVNWRPPLMRYNGGLLYFCPNVNSYHWESEWWLYIISSEVLTFEHSHLLSKTERGIFVLQARWRENTLPEFSKRGVNEAQRLCSPGCAPPDGVKWG